MYKILRKEELNEQITLFEVHAPYVARKVKAGHFQIRGCYFTRFIRLPAQSLNQVL